MIEAIGTRSTYFALLNENPPRAAASSTPAAAASSWRHRSRRIRCCWTSCWTTACSARGENRAGFAAELDDRLARVDAGDPERLVEALCQFKRAAIFRIAIADLAGGCR